MVAVFAGGRIYATDNNSLDTRVGLLEAYDTYHNLSIQSPFANRGGSFLSSQYTKVKYNGVEGVLIYVVVAGTPSGVGNLIATLPTGYKPASTQDYVCSGLGSSTTLTPVIEVGTDGTIKLWDNAASNANWHLGWQFVKGPLS